jgi:hypothetical protein
MEPARQFAAIDGKVEPTQIDVDGETVTVTVHQTVHSKDGELTVFHTMLRWLQDLAYVDARGDDTAPALAPLRAQLDRRDR